MKNICVTGALGFIGTTLVRRLLKQDGIGILHLIDNLCNSSLVDKEDIFNDERVYFDESSVEEFRFSKIVNRYDQIYHLASPVGPAGVLNYAGKMGPMIVSDAYKMAELAIKHKARLLDISTSEVYGREPGDIPQKEDIDKIVPPNITIRLEYGVAKLLSEISLINLAKVTGLQVNLVRPFNIVGIGQKGEVGFVLPRFVEAALADKPLTVFGNGEQKRTFTSVDDFVDAIILVMNSDIKGEIFNIGNADNIRSIRQLAEMVLELTDSKSKIELVDPKTIYGPHYAEAWNKIPDATKIKTMLGWEPKDSFVDIVTKVVRSYKELK